jgi:hypothetical protein
MNQMNQMGQMGQTDQTDQTGQMDSMPDMAGADQMTGMTGMTDQTAMPVPGQRQAVPIVGVLAGVAVVAVIALIIVVVYFVAVRKCTTNNGTDCTACAPTFDFTAPETFVSCNASECKGTQSPWAGHWCTSLGTVSATSKINGDALYKAEQAMAGTASMAAPWTDFANFCATAGNNCIGASIIPTDSTDSTFTFTPCLQPSDGSASTKNTPDGQVPAVFLYAPKANIF